MTDAEQLRHTRWMVVAAGVISVLFALFFRSMVSAWIFMSTVLVAAALVPVLAALYLPVRLEPRAGLWSSIAGLVTAVSFYAMVNAFGVVSEEWGTTIWTVTAAGARVDLWQEYAVLVALPSSAAGFALGQVRGGGS